MPTRIATNQTTLATTYTLGATDNLYVPVGVSSLSSENKGASSESGSHKIVVSGSLYGTLRGIQLVGTLSADSNYILINSSGTVESFSTTIEMFSKNNRIVNFGNISSAFSAINVTSSSNSSDKSSITNYGTITGDDAIYSGGGTTIVNNFGVINSGSSAIFTDVGDDIIRNRGTITGNIRLFGGNDQLYNRSVIIGNVSLESGSDLLDNRGGIIDGQIDMGAGADTFKPGASEETATGDAGIDTLDFSNSSSVRLALDGSFAASGVALGDSYTSFENVVGSRTGANVLTGDGVGNALTGGDGKDTLSGLAGADTLIAGLGDDILLGGSDADTLIGGDGIDRLTGGSGSDQLSGGVGADLFIFGPGDFSGATREAADSIGDFRQPEGDKIDLSLVDAISSTGKNDAFTFIGTAAFNNVAGELRYTTATVGFGFTERLVLGDTNGDGIADFAILLLAVASPAPALFATDFVL